MEYDPVTVSLCLTAFIGLWAFYSAWSYIRKNSAAVRGLAHQGHFGDSQPRSLDDLQVQTLDEVPRSSTSRFRAQDQPAKRK